MRSGKTMSLSVFLAVLVFITHNGYLHSAYLLYHAKFDEDWFSHANTYIGEEITSFRLHIRNNRKTSHAGVIILPP